MPLLMMTMLVPVVVMVMVMVTVMVATMRRKDEEAEKRTGSNPREIRSANCSCFLAFLCRERPTLPPMKKDSGHI